MTLLSSLLLALLPCAAAADDDAFESALRVLAERYPEQARSGAFYEAAIQGMAAYVDALGQAEGSALLDERGMARERARQRGERQGIGVQFWVLAGRGLVINQVYGDSPAARAQLASGDLVVAINDQPLTGRSRESILTVLDAMRGQPLVLDVRRQGASPRSYRVPWGSYWLNAVEPCADQDVPCLEVQHFGTGAAAALEQALKTVEPSKGLMLDLRTNDQGLLDEMVAAADLFLEAGEVVALREAPGGASEALQASASSAWRGRLVLVVDEGTCGLAEAFAAALREQVQARLVGTVTGGCGTTESYHPLGDGLVLRLADVKLRSPAGRAWSPSGLLPDLTVEHPDVLLSTGGMHAPPDLQVEAAIRLLRGP